MGVSSDGFGGDTGAMTLERYLAPGGVDCYAETAQRIGKLTWLDVNGDGQTECVLSLLDGESLLDQMVILSEPTMLLRMRFRRSICVDFCEMSCE